ncbi:MAG: TonB-dependent receptor [Bacteroidota bacterium]|nr:TonB-dependent receptor [Bacteroidota bacterium]
MKKTNLAIARKRRSGLFKVLLVMKLTIALLFISLMQVSAKGLSQSKVTLKLQAVELKKVLFQIEKKSNCRFLYNDDAISLANQKVEVNVENAYVTDVLNRLFAGTNLVYKVLNDNLIVLSSKDNIITDVKVSGKVTNAAGEPLVGASILVKGSKVGTATDANGNFTITAPDNATLVVSMVGFESQEIRLEGQKLLAIRLQPSTQVLDQVVVIGYGTATKRDLTGSIVKVDGKEVADKPNANPIASLQSKVAGLYVVNNGTPGQAPDIRIRGTVSIGQVHPLYVVDGIFNDNIDYLNPNDIESIEILKDPSSLAIFGVKGATGVIAITTKKAKAGKTVINFSSSYGFKTLVDKIKMANASQFNTLFAEENANNNVPTPDYSALNANTDWIDAVTRTGNFSNSSLSVSSSTEKNRFNFGLSYIWDQGIIKHEQLDKVLLSLSDELKVSKSIKLGVNFNTSRTNNPYNATWVLDAARKVMPQVSASPKQFRVQNPYGGDSLNANIYSGLDAALQNSGVVNPLLILENEWDKTINVEYRYVGSVYTDINLTKNLNFRATWYGDMSNTNVRSYAPLYYYYDPLSNNPTLIRNQTSLTENDNDWRKFQQDYILTYKKSFSGGHNLTATAGFTTYYFGNFNRQVMVKQGTDAASLPIPNDKRFWYVSSGFGVVDPTNTVSSQSEYSTVSVLGRVLYNYKGKYYLNASLRDDASSRLPNHQHQQFWAAGAAWEITKEDFMQNQKIFDFLKLKGSVGVLGNQTSSMLDGTPINYPAYPNLQTGINAIFGTNIFAAAQPAYIANPDLKWETVNASEIGIELNAFQNRLHFEANYYNKVTNNLMTYVDRSSIGLPNELINGGSLRNWGEELSATWTQNLNKDFTLSVNGNITFMKNEVLSLAKDLPTGVLIRSFMNNGSAESRTMVGQPIGSFYGYVVDGLYQSYADILASPVASSIGSYRPGDFKFRDVNKDGVITADDRTVIGNPTPKFIYGTSVNLTYKRISLGVDLGGVYGNDVFRTWGSLESPFQRVNYPAFKMNRWHGAGTSNWEPIISQADRFNYNGSTYNIEDGSYFRIRNIQLGYAVDEKFLSRYKISALRIFANVQNLKTWKHNLGYSPEYGGDATAFGYDNGGGAIPMITTVGLNVTF